MARVGFVVCITAILGALPTAGRTALAAQVRIPLHIDYLELNAALKQQLYTAAGGRAELWRGEDRCQYFYAENPRFNRRAALVLETDGELSVGLAVGGKCVTPISWKGIMEVEAAPYVAGLTLKFHITDLNLYDLNHRKSVLVGRGFDLVKSSLIPRLETFSYDLGAPTRQLANLVQSAAPEEAAQRVRLALATLKLEPAVAVEDDGVSLALDIAVPEMPPLPPAPASAAPFTAAELAVWQTTLDNWDAFLVFAIKQIGATVVDPQLRLQMLDVLLDSRERLIEALAQPQRGPDPVRILFLDEWSRLRAIIESAAQRGMLGGHGLEFVSFISAGDALFALDQAAPALGMRISADDLRRLARIMAPQVTSDPLSYSFDEDSQLQGLLGIPGPLEIPGPLIAPEESAASPAVSPATPSTTPSMPLLTPPQSAVPAAPPGPVSALMIILRHLDAREALAAEDTVAPHLISLGRDLRGVVVDQQNADRYSTKLNQLLALAAQRELGQRPVDGACAKLYPILIRAVAWQESCWRQFIIRRGETRFLESKSGDIGLMQVNKYVWRGFYSLPRLRWDIVYNATAGAEIVMRNLQGAGQHLSVPCAKDPGNLARSAYCGYNGGPGAYGRWRRADEPASARAVDEAFWLKFRAMAQGQSFDIVHCAADWDHAHGQ